MPYSQKECLKSWKRHMPNYEVKLWDEDNFDVKICQFTHDAYRLKKYSMVTDVARLHTLFKEGGIYLDTDVEIFRPFDDLLTYGLFSGIEIYPNEFGKYKHLIGSDGLPIDKSGIFTGSLGFLAAVIGAVKGNQLIKDTLDYFLNQPFIFQDKSLNTKIINPAVLAHKAIKYGFVYEDKTQHLENNMLIISSQQFQNIEINYEYNPYLVHHSAQSWVPKTKHEMFIIKLDKLNLLKTYEFYKSVKRKITLLLKN